MLQIGAALFYYKLGQTLLQIGATLFYYKSEQTVLQVGAASLLQIGTSIVANWGSYYKLGQPLLENGVAFTNWGKIYYKLGQVLQIRAIITNWGVTIFALLTYNRRATIVFGGTGCLTNYIHMESVKNLLPF